MSFLSGAFQPRTCPPHGTRRQAGNLIPMLFRFPACSPRRIRGKPTSEGRLRSRASATERLRRACLLALKTGSLSTKRTENDTQCCEECPVRSLFCLLALNVGRKDLVFIQIWSGIDSGVGHIANAYQSRTRVNHFQFQLIKLDTVCQP